MQLLPLKEEKFLNICIKISIYLEQTPTANINWDGWLKKVLSDARKQIAMSINASENEIFFTSGACESNNTIMKQFCDKNILTDPIEHKCILNAIRHNKNVNYINVNQDGRVLVDDFKKKYNESTDLVTVMFVNNETGVIQPVEEISKSIDLNRSWYHIDAVQAYSHIDIDVKKLNCDSLSLSAHKIGATNGFGILYSRKPFKNLIYGGNQEQTFRGGTSFVMGAYAMSKAFELANKQRDHNIAIKHHFLKSLRKNNVNFEINGDLDNQTNHIVNIFFKDIDSETLITYLDINDIMISQASACTAGSAILSHVITEMYDEKRAKNSVRFSFGFTNTLEEVEITASKIAQLLERINCER